MKMVEEKRKKEELEAATERMIKDRGIKSLLQRLRHNVETSAHSKPEPIAASRLIVGEEKKKIQEVQSSAKKGKVLINPVPVMGRHTVR